MSRTAGWNEADSATNDTATAAHSAETGNQHVITSVQGAFSAAAIALLQIKDGSTVVWELYIHNADAVLFQGGIKGTRGNAVSAVLAAGGSGIVGKVNIQGFTF